MLYFIHLQNNVFSTLVSDYKSVFLYFIFYSIVKFAMILAMFIVQISNQSL